VLGLVVVLVGVAVAIALLVASGGDDGGTGTAGAGGATPRPREDTAAALPSPEVSVPVAPRAPTPEEVAAREEERRRAEAEREAEEALARARRFAIETWKGDADTDAVLDKYRFVSGRWSDTVAGKAAKELVRRIKAKEVHPHPERSYASEATVAETKAAWEAAQPEFAARVAAHRYLEAKTLVPASVADAGGALMRDLDFARQHLDHLVRFQDALAKAVPALPEAQRTVATPRGRGPIVGIELSAVQVRLGATVERLAWSDLPASVYAALAARALADGGADALLLRMAFAYAHHLEEAFWDADLELGAAADRAPHAAAHKAYADRWNAREAAGQGR
jgi:hypothetical protein